MSLTISTDEWVPCLRPGVGKRGKPVVAIANFYAMRFPEITIHQYDVKISPELDRRDVEKARPIWHKFKEQHLPGSFAIYDGRNLVYAPAELPFGPSVRHTVILREAGPRFPAESYQVTLVKTSLVCNLRALSDFVNAKIPRSADTIATLQCLNILFNETNDTKFLKIRESFFTHDAFASLNGGLEVYKGIFESVRLGVGKVLLNVDTAVAVMHSRGSLITLCAKFLGLRDEGELSNLSPQNQRRLLRVVKGLRVFWTHRGERGLTKDIKIKNITAKGACQEMFVLNADVEGKKPEEISIADYFMRAYNIRLRYPNLPCVVVQKDSKLPMEVCGLVPGQRYSRKLGPLQVAEMIKITCIKPADRLKAIEAGVSAFKFADNDYMRGWGIEVSPKPAQVKGRLLPPPKLEYHVSSSGAIFEPRPGVWDMRGKKLCNAAILGSWSVVSFVQQRRLPEEQIKNFIGQLARGAMDLGLKMKNMTPPIVYGNPAGNIAQCLKEAWVKAGNAAKAQPQIIVCIVPAVEATLYAEIKRIMNTELGCASQCLVSTKLTNPKGVGQYCGNVALKLNAKLGGANTFLPQSYLKFIAQAPTIIIGADVNHPGKGEDHVPSFCAVVGSMDSRGSRYTSACRAQANRLEMIHDFGGMVREVLRKFYGCSGQKPQRIIVYRDGLSEGQFQEALDVEVKAIRLACAALEATYRPKITFVVCQKRHHTRFFPATPSGGDRSGNLSAGFCVDTEVVHPTEYDFYILSHAGLQGTSRPTHYRVLIDENNIGADDLQEMTYNLCYLYTRCPRSISIVPAVRYADQIAALERHHYNSSSRTSSDTASYTEMAPSSSSDSRQVSESEISKNYAPVKESLHSASMWWS